MTNTFSHQFQSSSNHIVSLPPLPPFSSQRRVPQPSLPYRQTVNEASHVSKQSYMTASSGVQSQIGARWKEDFTNTMNSGFAAGTPRTERRKGVREGRETGVAGMPVVKGVGRTGKAPATVPKAMAEAARKQAVRRQVVDMEVYEGIGTGPPAVKKKRKDKGRKQASGLLWRALF